MFRFFIQKFLKKIFFMERWFKFRALFVFTYFPPSIEFPHGVLVRRSRDRHVANDVRLIGHRIWGEPTLPGQRSTAGQNDSLATYSGRLTKNFPPIFPEFPTFRNLRPKFCRRDLGFLIQHLEANAT